VARDHSFDAPEMIAAGLTAIEMRNVGQEPHHVQLVRLNDNVTIEQFTAALAQGPGPIMALVSLDGGVGALGNGDAGEVIVNLRPGQYVLLCFIESPDGVPHLAKGMVKPVRVAAAPAVAVPVAAPAVAGTVTMKDFTYDLPATMGTGRQTYRVVNDGPQQPHETNIVRLNDGKTLADVTAWDTAPSGPPPFTAAGGMNGLSVNASGFMVTQLQPGNYAAVCFIPDPGSGRSHLELGMGKEFTVR
jgi:hypothetical protein